MKISLKKTVTAAMLAALTVALSGFYIPIGVSKCYPIQHMVNVLCAVFLGPGYGVMAAFCTSLIRNLMGTGSLLAFPGSMVGALLCGILYEKTGKLLPTYLGEVIGTGILAGCSVTRWQWSSWEKRRLLFTYVMPFLMSTCCGTIMAAALWEFWKRAM